jgi:hypothetical protein
MVEPDFELEPAEWAEGAAEGHLAMHFEMEAQEVPVLLIRRLEIGPFF